MALDMTEVSSQIISMCWRLEIPEHKHQHYYNSSSVMETVRGVMDSDVTFIAADGDEIDGLVQGCGNSVR